MVDIFYKKNPREVVGGGGGKQMMGGKQTFVAFGQFPVNGASLFRCIVDMRSQMGHGVTNAMSAVMLLTMATNGLAYLLVWFKIRQVSALMLTAGAAPAGRIVNYHRTARVMTIFVAAYVLQWWPYVVASIWTLIKKHPPVVIYILAVFTCNMGGVFNALAYTILRRRLQASNRASVTSSNIAS